MKLGMVISRYGRNGGLERVATEYARGLRDWGHNVTVFCQQAACEPADAGIVFKFIGGFQSQIALRAATFPVLATAAVRRYRFDNVLSFGSSLLDPAVVRLPGPHRSWIEASQGQPNSWMHKLNPHHAITLALDRHVLGKGKAKAVLAACEWAAAEIGFFYPKVKSKIRVLPDGVNLEEFFFEPTARIDFRSQHGISIDRPVLFCLATEARRKGLPTIMQSIRIIAEHVPDICLVVGGKVPTQTIRSLASKYGVMDHVVTAGFITNVRSAYCAADVLVFPTQFDPWGLPIVEALACGTPVVASEHAGAASAIQPGNGLRITNPTDPAVVAEAVMALLATPANREAIRASIRPFQWKNIISQLETILTATAS